MAYVLLGHLFLLALLCYHRQIQHHPNITHHLVDTYYVVHDTPNKISHSIVYQEPATQQDLPLNEPIAIETTSSAPLPTPQPAPPAPVAAAIKPKSANKTVAKPTAPSASTISKATPSKDKKASSSANQHQALASLMEKSLKNLETPKATSSLSSQSTKKTSLSPLRSENFASSYRDQLIALLEDLLIFPEAGDVCVEIKILPSGKITACHVIKSLSSANQAYVLKVLPTLSLPACSEISKEEQTKTLRITLVGRARH
ncbi:MAG: hypothetical protein JSR97_02265 [Verrucomicrobia bacterium]|nr:hypothetical protein [Verrucomicrobiota bacterium]